MNQGSGYEYEQLAPEAVRGSNPLGVVGFVLAFCLPPVGLLLSLIALFMRPKGFAIAGVIVSLITSAVAAALIYFGVFYLWPAAAASLEIVEDTTAIMRAIETHKGANDGALPANLSALTLSSDTLTDPWGTAYLFEVSADGTSWTLKVAGPDGGFDDKETATISPGMGPNEIGNAVGESLGEAIMRHAMKSR